MSIQRNFEYWINSTDEEKKDDENKSAEEKQVLGVTDNFVEMRRFLEKKKETKQKNMRDPVYLKNHKTAREMRL